MGNQASTPINDDDEEKSDADYSEYEAYQVAYILNKRYLSKKQKRYVYKLRHLICCINSLM